MSRSVILTTENVTGLPAITPDPLAAVVEDEGAQANAIPSSYEGNNFSITLVFNVKYIDDGTNAELGTLPADDIFITYDFGAYGLTGAKVSSNKYRISGTSSNIFSGSYYQFVLKDLSVATLPFDTTEDFLALVLYNMPNSTAPVQLSYPFNVLARDDFSDPNTKSNVSFTVAQWYAWSYQSAVSTVKSLVAAGEA